MQRLVGVLFSPIETLADIARRPNILAPLLLIVIVTIVTTAIIVPKMDFETMLRETFQKQSQGKMSEADVDRNVTFAAGFAKVMAWASPIIGIGVLAIIAAIFLGLFRAFGGEGNFKQYFSVTLYTWVPQIIKSLAMVTIILARGEPVNPETMPTILMSHPGALVDMKENAIAFALLSSIELFNIWTIVLMVIGFAFVSGLSRTKAAVIVVSLYVVTVLFKLAGAAMQALGNKAASS
ncbi:MAG TPA: Yip1 family protein [Thermoanaerobaculia bacterium]